MGLHEEFDTRLKAAMKAKDVPVLDVIRMIRSRVKKTATSKNVEIDDKLYMETIQNYVKQMQRARAEYEAAGDKGAEMAEQLKFEVEYLTPFLPKTMGEEEVRTLVKGAIEEHGISNPRQAGRIVGLIMKGHRGQVDPMVVKRIAQEELS